MCYNTRMVVLKCKTNVGQYSASCWVSQCIARGFFDLCNRVCHNYVRDNDIYLGKFFKNLEFVRFCESLFCIKPIKRTFFATKNCISFFLSKLSYFGTG
jgi:hypothetical protein